MGQTETNFAVCRDSFIYTAARLIIKKKIASVKFLEIIYQVSRTLLRSNGLFRL